MEDNNNNAIVVQRDATTCAPLVGEPKSLISKGGKNVLDYNQDPPLEFVSDKNRLDCFAFARNDVSRHPEGDSPKDLQTLESRFFAFHARIKRIRLRLTSSARVAQNDATTCSPLEGGPKSLISRRGKNAMNSNQEPSPELDNGETCQGLLRRFVHKITNNNEISPHNDIVNKNSKGLINFKKVAFTLAEVLITLGIIGVVAAITIPGLINNYKANKLRTQFLKSYSTIQQVFKLMQEDDVSLNPQDYNGHVNPFYRTFIKYLVGATDCGHSAENLKPICYIRNLGVTYKLLPGYGNLNTDLLDDGGILLQDGTMIYFENDFRQNYVYLFVDINGYKNPPNRLGYDLFAFEFCDGVLSAMGDKNTHFPNSDLYCNYNQNIDNSGIACSILAKSDTEYFKKLVKNVK